VKILVLDTSALVSGLLKPRGPAARLVNAFFADRLRLAYTDEILAEYVDVLSREEFKIDPSEQMAVVIKIRASGVFVKSQPVPAAAWPDADDLPFVGAALATQDKILVTFNPRDFAPACSLGVQVVRPSEALELL
jgi:uncharacterized protein